MKHKFNSTLTNTFIGSVFTFISQNAGENSDAIEKDALLLEEKDSVATQQTIKPKPITKRKSGSKQTTTPEIYDLIPGLYQLPHTIDLTIKENNELQLSLSLPKYSTSSDFSIACSAQPSMAEKECHSQSIITTIVLADTNLPPNVLPEGTISFKGDCSLNNKTSPSLAKEGGQKTECLGGVDIKGDGVKLKVRGTMTRDTDPNADRFGLCPEGDVTKCAGVEIGIQIDFE